MKYVLIALLLQGDVPVTVTGIFPDKAACERGALRLEEKHPDVHTACFEAGES